MRYSASEKFEIIELVEQSSLSIRRTLAPIGIPRWRREASRAGHHGLAVSSTAVSSIAKVPMPTMTRTNSKNGVTFIYNMAEYAERPPVA